MFDKYHVLYIIAPDKWMNYDSRQEMKLLQLTGKNLTNQNFELLKHERLSVQHD